MPELRWILLALGLLVILGVYLWGRGFSGSTGKRPLQRAEPSIDVDDPGNPGNGADAVGDDADLTSAPAVKHRALSRAPEKIVTIRLVPREKDMSAETAVLAMRRCGLEHGEYGIFHRLEHDSGADTSVFSVSNLTEPGSFDLTKLSEIEIPGLSIFMVLPGEGDPVHRFDAMLDAARKLARELDGELLDDMGSSWSIQRERYVREEMIQYRHQMERG